MTRRHGREMRGQQIATEDRGREGRFGLMFKQPPFEPAEELLSQLAERMTGDGSDNPAIPAGFTYLGQFLDHDLTLDTTPLEDAEEDPLATTNFRSARFDLDSVYGAGPGGDPQLYTDDGVKLRVEPNEDGVTDLPRHDDGTGVMVEPRNEENLLVVQIHLAMLRFHNALVDFVREEGLEADPVLPAVDDDRRGGGRGQGGSQGQGRGGGQTDDDVVFAVAQRLCRWYYQWVVVHDFLPRIVGQDTVDERYEQREHGRDQVNVEFFNPKNPHKPMLPLEFAVAAYRFGHSMVQPGYQVNATTTAAIFGEEASEQNLNGFRPVPAALAVDWDRFFTAADDERTQPAQRIDTRMADPLANLPTSVVGKRDDGTRVASLAERNLLRGARVGLASGQSIATATGIEPLPNRDLGVPDDAGWDEQAPLWFYVLKEAELVEGGTRLGPVGGRVVAEVLLGLLERDQRSYLSASHPNHPFVPREPIAATDGRFTMVDLLRFAGVL